MELGLPLAVAVALAQAVAPAVALAPVRWEREGFPPPVALLGQSQAGAEERTELKLRL